MKVKIVLFMVILVTFVMIGSIQAELIGTDATKYFSRDYSEARQKFIEASNAVGAHIDSFEHHLKGPKGESLFTDVAIVGPKNASTIIVLESGTHGVEGFAGSAIQTGLLIEGINSGLEPNMRIMLIHALNPYGFAHLRRFNEDNIDLNRNFLDHSKPYPANPGYEELRDAISPKSISYWINAKSIFKLLLYRLTNDKSALKKAISVGQYTDPQGIFYGGHKEVWSNKIIRTVFKRYLSKAEKVLLIDFHTGLGPYGNAEVILNENEHSDAYKRSVEWWGDRVKNTASDESVSVHLETTLKLAFAQMGPNVEITAVSLEFGTYSPLKVFWALRAENWLHNYGDIEHPDRDKIKTKLLRAFYPDDDAWKLKVWNQGKEVVKQALNHMQ
jgi:predicted deacylase